jgi:hypothetical protein
MKVKAEGDQVFVWWRDNKVPAGLFMIQRDKDWSLFCFISLLHPSPSLIQTILSWDTERERERDLDKEQQQIRDSTSPNALGFKSQTEGPEGTILYLNANRETI